MASNMFGNYITNSTLEESQEYARKLRLNRAHAALNMRHVQNKDVNARNYVKNLWKQSGRTGAATLCLVYNATGETVKFVTSHDWYGKIGSTLYPAEIANGQWGAFLHMNTSGEASGSSAAVVYRGKTEAGEDCDWMLAWSSPLDRNNKVYSEIRGIRHFETPGFWGWGYISERLHESGLQGSETWNGCLSTMTNNVTSISPVTANSGTSIFEAILTLKDA